MNMRIFIMIQGNKIVLAGIFESIFNSCRKMEFNFVIGTPIFTFKTGGVRENLRRIIGKNIIIDYY